MRNLALSFAACLFAALTLGAQVKSSSPSRAATSSQPANSAGPNAAPQSALDKATLESYLRHLYGAFSPDIQFKILDPKASKLTGFKEVTVIASNAHASQEETFVISDDGKKIIRGMVLDLAESPFQSELSRLKTESAPAFGPESAPVNLVIFSDFQCSFCREEAKILRTELAAQYPSQVRVFFKDYPLEAIHPWAKPAAIAGRCVYKQKPAVFWDYHDWIFEKQAELTPETLKQKVIEFAGGKGLETEALGACIDSKATEAEVSRSMTEARALGINSTPTMFVNGRRLVGQLGWPQLKQFIDHEIEYAKTHGQAAKCCEVTLPNLANPAK